MLIQINYQQLPRGKPTESHETVMLERLRIGEYAGYSKTSTHAEDLQSPNYLLNGDEAQWCSNGEDS